MSNIKFIFLIIVFINTNLYSQSYVYSPNGCEYSVRFEGKPELNDSYVSLPDGELYNYIIAQYVNEKESSMQNAETMPFEISSLSKGEIKSELLHILRNYAESNGLSNCEFGYEENYLGRVGKLRGYKTIKGRKCTFGSQIFCGDYSILVIKYGSLSIDYPTAGITDFIDSVKR